MEFTVNLADKIDPVAIYVASVVSVVFLRELWRWWRRRLRLRGSASANVQFFSVGGGANDPKTDVIFTLTNVGNVRTTTTNIGMRGFRTGGVGF